MSLSSLSSIHASSDYSLLSDCNTNDPIVTMQSTDSISVPILTIPPQQQQQPQNIQQEKKVQFECQVVKYKVLHINNYKNSEIAATWYSPVEIHNRIVKNNKTRLLIARNKIRDDDDDDNEYDNNYNNYNSRPKNKKRNKKYCSRGLEQWFGSAAQRLVIQQALDSVMEEQDLQREEGMVDDELIAMVYSSKSQKSMELARQRAILDQEAVGQYIKAYSSYSKVVVSTKGEKNCPNNIGIHMNTLPIRGSHQKLSPSSRAA